MNSERESRESVLSARFDDHKIYDILSQNILVGKKKSFYTNFIHAKIFNRLIGLVGRVFANGPGDLGSIPCRVIPPCFTLSSIRYVPRVKWSNPGKEVAPSPVVAIEKGAFGSPSTKVANFSLLFIYTIKKEYTYMSHQQAV